MTIKMYAYPDSKCAWGYVCLCDTCKNKAQKHVDIDNPIDNPPAVRKKLYCETCGKLFILETKKMETKKNEGDEAAISDKTKDT